MAALEFPLNITIRQGVDYLFEMAFYEEDDVTPIEMSTKKIALTVKPAIDADDTDGDAYVALDTADFTFDEDPEVAGGGVDNRITVWIPRSLTKPIPVGTYPVDLDVLDEADRLHTYGYGDFVVKPQAGRREPV